SGPGGPPPYPPPQGPPGPSGPPSYSPPQYTPPPPPPGQYAPPGYTPPPVPGGYVPGMAPPNDSQATMSLVLGIASVICCAFLGPVAIYLGNASRQRIQASGGTLGRG